MYRYKYALKQYSQERDDDVHEPLMTTYSNNPHDQAQKKHSEKNEYPTW
jgi:hypothetical protein